MDVSNGFSEIFSLQERREKVDEVMPSVGRVLLPSRTPSGVVFVTGEEGIGTTDGRWCLGCRCLVSLALRARGVATAEICFMMVPGMLWRFVLAIPRRT
jgi:hypothetical protein